MEFPLLTLPSKSKPSDSVSIRSAFSVRSAQSHGSAVGSLWSGAKEEKGRVPRPSHRHAAPSAPWPWVDLDDEVDRQQLERSLPPIPPRCDHQNCQGGCWKDYPQSRFPNWTKGQVKKSKILDAITDYSREGPCIFHQVDVDAEGLFTDPGPIVAKHGDEDQTWDQLIYEKRPTGLRIRALFIENISGPLLKMLGAKYNIEPFFWSSSLNWIPSRFQEEVEPGVGDHITITLSFVRSMSSQSAAAMGYPFGNTPNLKRPSSLLGMQKIDPHAPLMLHSNNTLLVLDLLAVHLIRHIHGSTIISFHPTIDLPATTASFLHERIRFAGQSVYWQSMFQEHRDPTFLLLVLMWHAMYAWDEALDNLYDHICNLESRVIQTEDMPLTQELHVLRAHHLHYSSLLDDASKNVTFIRDTHNPAMDSDDFKKDRESSKKTLTRECANLLANISRLKEELQMQERRLKNVMDLVFSSVNIHDSHYTRIMTEAAVRDSAAMKQVAYLTMFFLPATFMSGVFGMNIKELNPGTLGTIKLYFTVTIPLTAATIWIITAFQSTYIFPQGTPFIKRMGWPIYLLLKMFNEWRTARRGDDSKFDFNIIHEEGMRPVKSKSS